MNSRQSYSPSSPSATTIDSPASARQKRSGAIEKPMIPSRAKEIMRRSG